MCECVSELNFPFGVWVMDTFLKGPGQLQAWRALANWLFIQQQPEIHWAEKPQDTKRGHEKDIVRRELGERKRVGGNEIKYD